MLDDDDEDDDVADLFDDEFLEHIEALKQACQMLPGAEVAWYQGPFDLKQFLRRRGLLQEPPVNVRSDKELPRMEESRVRLQDVHLYQKLMECPNL